MQIALSGIMTANGPNLRTDVDPATEVIVELSTAYIIPVYKGESIIGSKDVRRFMSPKGESSKHGYCVPHHRACHHRQESQLTLLDLHSG